MALGSIAARAAMATALFESKENLQVVLYLYYYYLNFPGCYTIVLELASSFENLNRHQIKTHDSESRGQEEAAIRDE